MPVGHVVDLRFHNFSLEPHEDCSFDFVEVHDSAGTGAASLMGRYPHPPSPNPAPAAQPGKPMAGEDVLLNDGFWGRPGWPHCPSDPILCPLAP